jgi:hypothetical protein
MKNRWLGVMALAAVSLLPSACMAQAYGYDGYARYEQRRDPYNIGYDRGWEEGARRGRADAHHYDRMHIDVRHGDSGWRNTYGSRSRYSDGFRRGFERGYERAFWTERRAHYRVGKDEGRYYDNDDRWDRGRR